MLDLKALENALSVIGNVGKGEITFTVDDVPVTMRVLTADEDMAVQRYARGAAASDDEAENKDAQGETLNLLERYKRASLAYAIVQVGDMDLRSVDFVATGELTDKGVPVKMSKYLAIRKVVDGWTRTATLALFQKYNELIQRVDVEAEKSVKFNTKDLATEITRVERRLEELRKEQEKADAFKNATPSKQMAILTNADQTTRDNVRIVAEQAAGRARNVAATPPVAPSVPEGDVVNVTVTAGEETLTYTATPGTPPPPPAAPPQAVRQRVMPSVEAPPPLRPLPVPVRQAAPTPTDSFGAMVDSLGDSPDDIAAETARIQAARAQVKRASMEALREESSDVIPASVGRRTPPHRAAANMSDAVLDTDAGSIESARTSAPVDGVETYRLGTANITGRRPPNPNARVPVDAAPKAGPNNPRFKPNPR